MSGQNPNPSLPAQLNTPRPAPDINKNDPVHLDQALAYLYDKQTYHPYDVTSQLQMIRMLLTSGEGFEKSFRDATESVISLML